MTVPVAVPQVPALARWDRIELAHTGTWPGLAVGGTQRFSDGHWGLVAVGGRFRT
jgi:hypothetical protein